MANTGICVWYNIHVAMWWEIKSTMVQSIGFYIGWFKFCRIPISTFKLAWNWLVTLQWRRNERDGNSNHQPHDCLLNPLFSHRSKKTSKLCVTGLCAWYSPVTGEFHAQRASNAENVSIRWCHHEMANWGQRLVPVSSNVSFINQISYVKNVSMYRHNWLCCKSSMSMGWTGHNGKFSKM